jgi:transcriptional regulator with XRE-family HTH domain
MRNRIAEHRHKRGLTQAQLAELIGVVNTTVSMWEIGINDIPASKLLKLSEILGVPINELVLANGVLTNEGEEKSVVSERTIDRT